MWGDIEEIDTTLEYDSYQGIMLVVFLDSLCPHDVELHSRLEQRFARATGGKDLRFGFVFAQTHPDHFLHFEIECTPSALFLKEGNVIERCDSAPDVTDMARDLIKKYS